MTLPTTDSSAPNLDFQSQIGLPIFDPFDQSSSQVDSQTSSALPTSEWDVQPIVPTPSADLPFSLLTDEALLASDTAAIPLFSETGETLVGGDTFFGQEDLADFIDPTYTAGYFFTDYTGQIGIDYLFDGGGYQGQLAMFSLEGMEVFIPGSAEFIEEAARRALSNSELGYVVIDDSTEGARFNGQLGERDRNDGDYLGVKSFAVNPNQAYGFMLVPNGKVEQVLNNSDIGGNKRPLFSLVTANPNEMFQMGQIVDVTGDGNTFVFEDLRMDGGSDRDYNDIIFQVRGAWGEAAHLEDWIAEGKDWRGGDLGQALIEYAKPYITPISDLLAPAPVLPGDSAFPELPPPSAESQPEPSVEPIVPEVSGPLPVAPVVPQEPTAPTKPTVPDLIGHENPHDEFTLDEPLAPAPNDYQFPIADQPLIGVIDTGFAANNPDLDYSRITSGRDRVANDESSLLQPLEGDEHGTHVLGIIAATQDNDLGIEGINDEAPVWVGRAVGSGQWAQSLVEFVDQAKASGQPNAVVNLSMDLTQVNPDGFVTTRYELTPEEWQALEYARQNQVLVVVAAGNDGGVMSALGQASQMFDNIITIGAAEWSPDADFSAAPAIAMNRSAYSSYGYGLDIVAPGSELSTSGSDLGMMTGTSVATAQVTGAISQVWAANPALSYDQVKNIIKLTATDLNTPGYDLESGTGLLNLAAAVLLAKVTEPDTHTTPAIPAPSTWSGAGRVAPTERPAFTAVNWSGKVTATIGANVRSAPTTNSSLVGSRSYGTTISFDGWTIGQFISYPGLGATDKWYRIAGTGGSQWISGAIIDTAPPVAPPPPPPPPPVAPPPPPPPPPVANRTPYVIKKRDTLWAIAQARLGGGANWTKISKDVAGTQFFTAQEARQLQIGQVVYLPVNLATPPNPPVSPPAPKPAPPPSSGGPITTYNQYLQRLYGGSSGRVTQVPSTAHNAIDSVHQGAAPHQVYSLTNGKVTAITEDQYGGKYVAIWNDQLQRTFIYLHFNSFNPNLRVGQAIGVGHYLGNEGWTGYTRPAGPGGRHTHVHVLRQDRTRENPMNVLSRLT